MWRRPRKAGKLQKAYFKGVKATEQHRLELKSEAVRPLQRGAEDTWLPRPGGVWDLGPGEQ